MFDALWRDLQHALRRVARDRMFAVIAGATLAVGVGATTALYSVLDSALIRPLPFRNASELVWVWGTAGPDRDIRGASFPEAMDWRELARSLRELSVYEETTFTLSEAGSAARQVEGEVVQAGWFEMLGASPVLGRVLDSTDDIPRAATSLVIGHGLWLSVFGGDRKVIGRTVQLDGRPFTIVGVMPRSFLGISFDSEAWISFAARHPDQIATRGTRWLGVIARRAPGVSTAAAQVDMDRVAGLLEQRYPGLNERRGVRLIGLRDAYLASTGGLILILFGAVLFLLVIACVNVTNLQVVRGLARVQELSLRNAIGASRARLVQQLCVEGVVVALAGAAVGTVLALWGLQAVLAVLPEGALPPFVDARLNARAIGFAVTVGVASGVFATLAPALRITRGPLARTLVSGTRTVVAFGSTGRRVGLQHILVTGECALAIVVLIGAGLLVKSFRELTRIDTGFNAAGVIAARVDLPPSRDADERIRFVELLVDRLRARPGIATVAVTSDAPLRGASAAYILQREGDDADRVRYYRHSVTPEYFGMLSIPIMAGRAFTPDDRANTMPVAIASRALAARLWPGEDPVGRFVHLEGVTVPVEIVGVAMDVRQRTLRTSPGDPGEDPDLYVPWSQHPLTVFDILVRGTLATSAMLTTIRTDLWSSDASLALYATGTLESAIHHQTATDRFGSLVLGIFAVLALALASVGIYGVMSFFVAQRRREMAIRLALGATPLSVGALVLKHGVLMLVLGGLAGTVVAAIATRVLGALLYNVQPIDALTFVIAASALIISGLAAVQVPALRAVRVQPGRALGGD